MMVARASTASKVAAKVRAVVDEVIQPGMDDFEKAIALHDWLVLNAEYDLRYKEYYADGVLLKGRGVCNSYALAYELLCKKAGLKCGYIRSKTHAWNVVRLSGKWYHIDCTWDDPIRTLSDSGGRISGMERHSYFALPYAVIKAQGDHTRSGGASAIATAYEQNYAYRTGALGGEIGRMTTLIQQYLDAGNTTFFEDTYSVYIDDVVGDYSHSRYIDDPERDLIAFVLAQPTWYAVGEPIKLTVKADPMAYSYSVKQKNVKITKLNLSALSKSLPMGHTLELYATITPAYASNKALSWKSSNNKVASLSTDPDGAAILTAHKRGKATITISAKDGSKKKATLKISVK